MILFAIRDCIEQSVTGTISTTSGVATVGGLSFTLTATPDTAIALSDASGASYVIYGGEIYPQAGADNVGRYTLTAAWSDGEENLQAKKDKVGSSYTFRISGSTNVVMLDTENASDVTDADDVVENVQNYHEVVVTITAAGGLELSKDSGYYAIRAISEEEVELPAAHTDDKISVVFQS